MKHDSFHRRQAEPVSTDCKIFLMIKNSTALEAGKEPGIGYATTCGNFGDEEVPGAKQTKGNLGSQHRSDVQYALLLQLILGRRKAMERYKKKDMLRMTATLAEAGHLTARALKLPGIVEMLAQCQESALLLGNALESRYLDTDFREQARALVRILEEYCENLYQISMHLSDGKVCRDLTGEVQRQLSLLREGIEQGLPDDRKEIVFLPYKASMWDSLESVWKAAVEDETCDTYVIPIPYYDRNPDGSFREMHYEGDQYPVYVPVVDYRTYDFEKRRPDVVYIHNPYDDCNYVTSVHPYFYSKNLKSFAELLVYIPYFVVDEINPQDQEAVEAIKHLCVSPGVMNADKIIVQSENIRQIYINVLTKESGNTKEARTYWKNKIYGLGSPKFDRVLTTKKEELEIPKEWLRIIRQPDGSWKKIIFYNTSVSALLHDSGKQLKKIESTIEAFKAVSEDIVLLWRPHPLTESTLISMRPEWQQTYQAIKDRYIREGWGIYDDTADMNRAVALSDAYYGDWSSIVYLYQKTGKRIMIQNPDVLMS
jgi:hypothetical protein